MELLPAIESLGEAFAESARLHADRPALSSRGKILSYAELDCLVDQTAARISAACGPGAGPVAIRMSHDLPAIAAVLGAIRAGRMFMPLDGSIPEADVRGLLDHAGAVALVNDADVLRLAPTSPVSDVEVDGCACIYYSSGSTGRSKGIAIPHRTVLHATGNYVSALDVTRVDRIALLGSLGFGASLTTMFGALLSGACLCLHDVRGGDIDALKRWLRDERISVYQSVTTLFRHFAASLWHGDSFPALRVIKLGGEPVLASDVALFQRRLAAGCRLVNGLGITEAGGNVCFFTLDRDTPAGGASLPVGCAVEGVDILVTDGELVLRSRFLASGYWRNDALTRDAFRRVPGSDDLVEYRTGDRGQIHPDGCVEFLGRRDSRVKIRGFMVDSADVEARVRAAPGVVDAAVVSTNRDGETRLTAFVVPESPHARSPRDALKPVLPDYAIPSRFINLPALPLTPGGKLDRATLSAIAVAQADPPRLHTPPRDMLEMQLKIIWERALGAANVGVTDNFFDLGGHSMTALIVSSLVSRSLGIELPLATLAQHATIEALANLLREKGWTAMNSPVVLLQAGEANPPLFCMPGAGSDVFALLDLARHLGDRPVYGLQHQGIDGDPQQRRSVEEMAAHYVEHLERIQPQGPVHLAGGSFGGVIAFELARQLAARGRRIAFLGLLDSYGTNYPVLRGDLSPRRRLLVLLRWFLPVGNKTELTLANLRDGVIQRRERIKAKLDLALRLRKKAPPLALRFIYLMEVCFRARDQYTFPPFDGRIHLFRAMTQPTEILYKPERELGWHGCTRDGIEVHDIPGRHGYLVREPNVAALAAAMNACMEAAERDADAAPTEYTAFVERSREAWNRIGGWWDEQIGNEGNPATVQTLLPVTERLLDARPGEEILDVACGNGWLSRRIARCGARITAVDFSDVLIERAKARTPQGLPVNYLVADATDKDQLLALGRNRFDAVLCSMALMDMAAIEPLFAALRLMTKKNGRIVFSVLHPDAPQSGLGNSAAPEFEVALAGQPTPNLYFHRSLDAVLKVAARHGFTLDATEEPVASAPPRFLVVRLRD